MKDIKNFTKIWKAQYEMKIDSSVASIWEIITKPKNLELVHPFCKSNETINWPGVGSKDILIYHSGLKYIREFLTWDKEKGYSLLIGEKNKDRSYVVWKIFKRGNDNHLKITVYPYFLRDYPKLVSFLPYHLLIIPKLTEYLKNVVRGIDWYLKTGKKIEKNQFGKHSWFS